MDEFAEKLKERIARRLNELKLTAITAATKARLPRDTIRNLYRQDSLPRIDTLAKIAEALETTVAYLVGETAYPKPDYIDHDAFAAAMSAVETAKPIPVLADAKAGELVEVANEDDPDEVLYLNVPGFEEAPLFAVFIDDDHAEAWYPYGRYVIFTPREIAGLRDGDNVVVFQRPHDHTGDDNRWEVTVRQLRMLRGARKGRNHSYYWGGKLATLAKDEEKYPSLPIEPRASDEEGWKTHPHIRILGVVVADLDFAIRPALPTMYPAISDALNKYDYDRRDEMRPPESIERAKRKFAKMFPEMAAEIEEEEEAERLAGETGGGDTTEGPSDGG